MNIPIYCIPLLFSIFLLIGCKPDKSVSQETSINPVSEDIVFINLKDSIELAGTISLPKKEGKFPAVILISGNGKHNRDEEFGDHKPFLDISNYFTKNGIAVLRYDKRGVGASEGDYNSATSFNFAEDVRSALKYLLTRSDIQKDNIGLIGHSEGGLIAPIVAVNNSDVAFIISLAGPSIAGDQVLLSQQKAIAKAKGMNKNEIEESQRVNREAFEIVKRYTDVIELKRKMTTYVKEISENDPDKPENMTFEEYVNAQVNGILNPWMINFLRYKPEQYIQQVTCPVFALNGSKDLQVLSKDNLAEWKRILAASNNSNVTVEELPNLNHLFQNCETGLPDEYETLSESFAPAVMEKMIKWIEKQLS